MKNIFSILLVSGVLILSSCNQSKTEADKGQIKVKETTQTTMAASDDIKPELLTAAAFKEKIWDYENNPEEWVYNGDLPCIVDFYADWCKPCKKVAPIMDDLADYYDGKVLIYKVNTDEQRELATVFQVRSIPSILFAPMEGKPAIQPGAMTKEDYIRIIDEFVLKINDEETKTKS